VQIRLESWSFQPNQRVPLDVDYEGKVKSSQFSPWIVLLQLKSLFCYVGTLVLKVNLIRQMVCFIQLCKVSVIHIFDKMNIAQCLCYFKKNPTEFLC